MNICTSISRHVAPVVTMSIPTPTGRPPTNDTEETLLNPYLAWNTRRLSIPTAHPLHLAHNHAHFSYTWYSLWSWCYNTSFSWQQSMVTLSTRSRMIWAMRILHCIVSSETQFETWWRVSTRAETCCLSNKYSTTLLLVFWLYYPAPSYWIYTGCHRRKEPNFGRVFLMLNYTDITQNTYIQSWTVTEIMAREVWNFDSCYTLTDCQIHIETGRNMWFL